MLVSVLASGSKGNTTLVQTKKLNILIDAGMNMKYIKERLNEFNLSPDDIDYIFLTHTHKDHIGALEIFLKKYNPTLCLGAKMIDDLDFLSSYDNILILDSILELEDIIVRTIKTSHDTSESFGYIFTSDSSSLVYITDTGYINSKYFKELKGKTAYYIESNHDIEMLTHGPYPRWLQERVLSDVGHLSNKFTGIYLSKLINENTKDIILLHLSEKNNNEEIALKTIKEYIDTNKININCANKNDIGSVIEI